MNIFLAKTLAAGIATCFTVLAHAYSCEPPQPFKEPKDILVNLRALMSDDCATVGLTEQKAWLGQAFPESELKSRSQANGYQINVQTQLPGQVPDQKLTIRLEWRNQQEHPARRIYLNLPDALGLTREMILETWRTEPEKRFMPPPHLLPGARQEAFLILDNPGQRITTTTSPGNNIVHLIYEDVDVN